MKKKNLKLLSSLLAIMTFLSLFTGCTSETAGPAGTGGESGSTAKKDTLTIAFSAEPTSMSTLDNETMESIYSALLTNNFLMRIDPKTMEPVCDLAESYELISDTEYVFHLQKGVKFHHGKEFEAEDVTATIENAKKYPGSAPYVGQIEKVEAMDKYTVKFIMLKPYPNLLYDLAFKVNFILPADLLKSGHDFSNEPVGTGPYKLVDWKKGDFLTYERFDDYFNKDETPSIKTIVWRVIPEGTTRTIALEAGEVDLVYQVETADVENLKGNAKITVEELTSVENYAMGINNDLEPFNDPNLRNAIAYAIDRKAVVDGALNGYGVPNDTSVAMGYWGSTDEGACTYNLDKAREYLKAWGGDPGSVTLSIMCWNDSLVRVGTVVQGCLDEIGIKVQIDTVDAATFSSRRAAGDYVAFFTLWSPSNAFTYVSRYHSSKRQSVPGACNDPLVDELVDKMQQEMDDNARLDDIHKIVARVNEIAAQPSIYQPVIFRAYNADLGGIEFSAHGYADLHKAYWK